MALTTLFADLSADPITLTTRLAPSALPLGVQLRRVSVPQDADAVARLRREAHPGLPAADPADAAAEVARHVGGQHGRPLPDGCLVAVDEQAQVIAWVLTVRPVTGDAVADPVVLDLCTTPPWRGRGLGRALAVAAMRAAAAEADRVGIRVEEGNENALSLARSLGFTPVGSAS